MTRIEDALQEWDEEFRFKPVRGRAARKSKAVARPASTPPKEHRAGGAVAARARLTRVVRKAPEVMVKITTGRRDPMTRKKIPTLTGMQKIKAHFDYIGRNGEVTLEDEQGNIIDGKEAVRELRYDWKEAGEGIPEESSRKEAFSIVLSMPPGTDRKAVTDAARAFAATEFGPNHKYVFATHEDEKHPHVHLCVMAAGFDGKRLNPRKPDLQRWREGFAEKLHEHGVEANATPREWRGKTRKPDPQVVRQIIKKHTIDKRKRASTVAQGRKLDIADELRGKHRDADAAENAKKRAAAEVAMAAKRQSVVNAYSKIAKPLSRSSDPADQQLALDITTLIRSMEPPKTAHRLAVEKEQEKKPRTIEGRTQKPVQAELGHAPKPTPETQQPPER